MGTILFVITNGLFARGMSTFMGWQPGFVLETKKEESCFETLEKG